MKPDRINHILNHIETRAAIEFNRNVVSWGSATTVASQPTPTPTMAELLAGMRKIQAEMEAIGPPFTGEIHALDTIPDDTMFVATICATKSRDQAICECFKHAYAGGPMPDKPHIKVVVCHPGMVERLRGMVKQNKLVDNHTPHKKS